MSSTPSRPFPNTGLGLKLTPLNSQLPRTPRSPYRPRSLFEDGLSLTRIIGTTVSSSTSFDTLSSPQIFAYTAGAAAVVVSVDAASNCTQRFYRARPTAVPLNAIISNTFAPSTPTNTANDGRNRAVAALRDTALPYSPSTPHTSLEWGDSPSSKTWTSRERIKAATCLSLSRDGRFLAVGETGYAPRVLVFSLQDASSDTPLVILNEHTYGVRAVAFSDDGRYLASLGSPNDGFLYVWSINQRSGAAKLHSSNKCTSFVKQMIWLGSSIVTIGTRHIKIWRVEDARSVSPSKQRFALDGTPQPIPPPPSLRTLAGRNVLLGPLVEATFTTLSAISNHQAIVCSEKGDICLLDDSEGQKLLKLTNVGFPINCVSVNTQRKFVTIGGRDGTIQTMSLDCILTPNTPPESPRSSAEPAPVADGASICALGFAQNNLITIDSKHTIKISAIEANSGEAKLHSIPFQAHGDAVLGVRLIHPMSDADAAFLTWSADGTIVFWNLQGVRKSCLKVNLEQLSADDDENANQCLVVRPSAKSDFLVVGDRYGVLRVVSISSGLCTFETRAHSSDIQDIELLELDDMNLLASCSRDRTVQLFRMHINEWTLIQTLDEHSASVSGLLFAENGDKLISCSTDRTIHIRQLVKRTAEGQELVGVVPLRILTLKASPVSITPCYGDSSGNFIVSLLDRTVATYEIASGRLLTSFRATDSDGAETVVLDSLVMGMPPIIPGRPTILAGVSGTDKSVRIYDGSSGVFLDREWGHTTSVTDVALLEFAESEQKTLISTGSDGTIMIWSLSPRASELQEPLEIIGSNDDSHSTKDTPSTRPPIRRVLSRAELAEFQRASPTTTSGNRSPPRVLRKKISRYGLSAPSPTLAPPPIPSLNSKHLPSAPEDGAGRKSNARPRSRSPPASPKGKESRRPSLASLEPRGRTKSTGNFSEFGSLNMATEQACRTLRAYRKKLLSSESVKEDCLKELDQELRLTAVALGEKSLKSKTISESVLTGLLDQYSERLVSMFDEKLRLNRQDSNEMPDIEERSRASEAPMVSEEIGV